MNALSLEERLRIGGYAAPRIRTDSGRKIFTYDPKTKQTTGETSLRAVQEELLKRADIEFSLDPLAELQNQQVCAGFDGPCPTAAKVPDKSKSLKNIQDRIHRGAGGLWHCYSCLASKRNAARTPEQRSEATRKGHQSRTPEQRSEWARKSSTHEQRSEWARKMNAAKTPEQRSELSRKMNAAQTPEQRRETARKSAETRRARKEIKP